MMRKNKYRYIQFECWTIKIPGLDSGVRRRDGFEITSLFVIPAKAGIQRCNKDLS